MPTQEQTQTGTAKASPLSTWKADSNDFDKWFAKQKYSLGATPSWTQVEEMRRVWCIASKTVRQSALHTQTTAQAGMIGKLVAAAKLAEAAIANARASMYRNGYDDSGTAMQRLGAAYNATIEALKEAGNDTHRDPVSAALLLAQKKKAAPAANEADDFRDFDNEEGAK